MPREIADVLLPREDGANAVAQALKQAGALSVACGETDAWGEDGKT